MIPFAFRRMFKKTNGEKIKEVSFAVCAVTFVVTLFWLASTTVFNTIQLDDKKCVAKYGAVEWDHQDGIESEGYKDICVHNITHERKPV